MITITSINREIEKEHSSYRTDNEVGILINHTVQLFKDFINKEKKHDFKEITNKHTESDLNQLLHDINKEIKHRDELKLFSISVIEKKENDKTTFYYIKDKNDSVKALNWLIDHDDDLDFLNIQYQIKFLKLDKEPNDEYYFKEFK